MAGRIPESFIDDLLARVDIVDVIQERIALKKSGRDWSARCPFHDERSASFTVSPTKQFYHCFGCGAHGSAIRFLMEYDRLEFPDAIEELAGRIGLKVVYEGGRRDAAPSSDTPDLYALLDSAAGYYQQELTRCPAALDYFERRGLNPDIIARFRLGYAADLWDGLKRFLGTSQQRLGLLEKGGMLIAGERGAPYDRFRDRVMFPIQDRRGRVIAFGGRVLGKDDGPKYLNSPETPLFHKGSELFALWQVRQAQQKLTRIIVVEGYMDVIALHQYGLPQAVATLGTATTREHAELLFRNCADVYFCFDGDRAGRQAAWRAVESVLPRMRDGRQAHFLFLPDGEDPDSLIRQEGVAGMEQRLQSATPLSQFFFAHQEADTNLRTADGRARLGERCKALISGIPEGTFRDRMQELLIEKTSLQWSLAGSLSPQMRERAEAMLNERVASLKQADEKDSVRHPISADTATAQRNSSGKRSLVRHAITALLQFPGFVELIAFPPAFRVLRQPGITLLVDMISLCRDRPGISTGAILEHFSTIPEAGALQRLAMSDLTGESEAVRSEFVDALKQLARQTLQQRIDDLLIEKAEAGLGETQMQELRGLLNSRNQPAT
ncbi:MAG: DNA primase [Tahibacter sp.]